MSLYADYNLEYHNKFTVENDDGFVIYSINSEVCYIEDIYIVPEKRRLGAATKMADWISDMARGKGCRRLMGSVVPTARNSDISERMLLRYGYKMYSSRENIVYYVKDL